MFNNIVLQSAKFFILSCAFLASARLSQPTLELEASLGSQLVQDLDNKLDTWFLIWRSPDDADSPICLNRFGTTFGAGAGVGAIGRAGLDAAAQQHVA